MSEEEIIDIIKDFLELREIYSSDNMRKSFLSIYKDAIQGLLDLYNKEKEKNKKLTDEYLIQRDLINAEFLNENYISKDKINSKIAEYQEILQSPIIKEDYKKEVEHIIRVLKELRELKGE